MRRRAGADHGPARPSLIDVTPIIAVPSARGVGVVPAGRGQDICSARISMETTRAQQPAMHSIQEGQRGNKAIVAVQRMSHENFLVGKSCCCAPSCSPIGGTIWRPAPAANTDDGLIAISTPSWPWPREPTRQAPAQTLCQGPRPSLHFPRPSRGSARTTTAPLFDKLRGELRPTAIYRKVTAGFGSDWGPISSPESNPSSAPPPATASTLISPPQNLMRPFHP